jgi:hypothetical protein
MASRLPGPACGLAPRRRDMTAWAERPRVEATLLNPALLAVLLAAAAQEYETEETGMPWPLVFLVPPLVLHRPTRDALPRNTRTHLSTWVRREPLLRAGCPARAAAMVPLTREGIRFGLRAGVLVREGASLTERTRRHSSTDPGRRLTPQPRAWTTWAWWRYSRSWDTTLTWR